MPHILLIEDYSPLARLMSLDLTEAGYHVSTHATGESAIAAFAEIIPDLVVLDWGLPGIDGLQVCQHLRKTGYKHPILFVTAMAGLPHEQCGLAAGATDYLVKPFTPQEFLGRVRQQLQAKEGQSSVPVTC